MYSTYAKYRDKKGLADIDVARLAEIPSSSLYDWKAGRYTPKADKLLKIAAVVGCRIEELINVEK